MEQFTIETETFNKIGHELQRIWSIDNDQEFAVKFHFLTVSVWPLIRDDPFPNSVFGVSMLAEHFQGLRPADTGDFLARIYTFRLDKRKLH
ncbi:hypothetical protein SAMN04488239_102237 [Ruegeria marina]|uniref:Uncharacterized protein n=1 Tax=Ruegeria marina TaxID=639004 RepID=A0A1G6LGP4_9RHOB|nr:hypothetical protein SAMN04488239_102237 [Ruegeria marina]